MSLKEYSSPLLVDPENTYRNTTDLLEERVLQAPEHVAFEIPVRNQEGKISGWKTVTTSEFRDQVHALAKGLIATGIKAEQTLAILSPTRYEWALADLAAMYAGALIVPIYDSSSPAQIQLIIDDAHVQFAIGGSVELCQKLAEAVPHGEKLTVWSMDETDEFLTLSQLAELGGKISDDSLEVRRRSAALDDPATVVYTSGTTGVPKGAIITHRNFLGQVLNVAAAYQEVVHENGRTIIFLPLAHVLARGLQMICLAKGMRIAHLSQPAELIGQLSSVRPTFLVVVPRVLEKIRDAVGEKALSAHLGSVWRSAVKTAIACGEYAEMQDDGEVVRLPRRLRVGRRVFDRLFYAKVRSLMGDSVDWILSGGAPLNRELSLLFRGMGLPVIEGYGLTETTAPLCGNLPGFIKSGTVGVPLPGATVRISETGEVLARGIGVFAGYRGQTNSVFDADGFFATGDLGALDDKGRLTLKGRSKDDLVTSGGKTISPFTWENAMEKSPLVAHAVMVGEGRKFLTALIVADANHAAGMNSTQLETALHALVTKANSLVSQTEQVKDFAVVSADIDDPELLTPTQKLKRDVFVKRWAEVVKQFYV